MICLEGEKVAMLWHDGMVRTSEGVMVDSVKKSERTSKVWDCIEKIGENRMLVGGLDKTTDPYTQVIKLVDSSGEVLDSLSYKLPDNQNEVYRIDTATFFEDLDLVVAKSLNRYLHLFTLAGDRLGQRPTSYDLGETGNMLYHIVMTEDNKLLVGTEKGLFFLTLVSN